MPSPPFPFFHPSYRGHVCAPPPCRFRHLIFSPNPHAATSDMGHARMLPRSLLHAVCVPSPWTAQHLRKSPGFLSGRTDPLDVFSFGFFKTLAFPMTLPDFVELAFPPTDRAADSFPSWTPSSRNSHTRSPFPPQDFFLVQIPFRMPSLAAGDPWR